MNTPLLDRLDAGEPLRGFSDAELTALAAELRGRILETVARSGGHLASNLGDVELTVALHRVFDADEPLVFDVSHQTYAHKLLTGRNARFDSLRRPGGLSGFSMPAESDADPFHLGHSSTSVSMALGLARAKAQRGEKGCTVAVIGDGSFTGGLVPVFAVYSTFLQRGYDMLVHDLAMNRLHAVIAVDRAGLVGADGETHQGVFDVAFLTGIPGFTVWSPSNYVQLGGALESAVNADGPVAVRYPKGGEPSLPDAFSAPDELHWFPRGSRTLLLTYGRLTSYALEASAQLGADLLVLEKIWPLSDGLLAQIGSYDRVFSFEEVVTAGGIGEHIAAALARNGSSARVTACGLPDAFIPQGDVPAQLAAFGLDVSGMIRTVKENL